MKDAIVASVHSQCPLGSDVQKIVTLSLQTLVYDGQPMNVLRLGLAVAAIVCCAGVPAFAQSDPHEGSVTEADSVQAAAPSSPSTSDTTDRPFKRLIPNLFSDLRRLPSKDSAVVFSVGSVLSLGAYPLDDYVTEHAADGTDQVFAVGGGVGSGYTQAGGALAVYVIGKLTKHPTMSHLGADLIRVQALTGFVTHGLKLAIRRDRPGSDIVRMPATYSFPSAHASASWASATVLWRHLGWKTGVPATLFAIYASGSRIQQKQHFLSDVLFGASIGVAAGRTITVGHQRRTLIVTPSAVRGGVGVVFTVAGG